MEKINFSFMLRKTIDELKDGGIISLEEKEYHIYPDFCYDRYGFISNHDHGLKQVAFLIENKNDITIDGNGAKLIFHGRISPFWIVGSKNIAVKNISFTYERPFFTEGEILAASHDEVVLKIDKKKYPYRIIDKEIYFYDEERWSNNYIKWFIEFDKERHAPAYAQRGSDLREQRVKVEELQEGVVKFKAKFSELHNVGNIINITHEQRYTPGIFIHESEKVLLEKIHIMHAGAMGVIAQNSKDITLDGVVIKAIDSMVSCNNDGTHFVNCDGKVELKNSTIMHQLDDGINLHGVYNLIKKIVGNKLIIENVHFQQAGNNVYRKGDKIAIVAHDTEKVVTYCNVLESITMNKDYVQLTVDDISMIKEGDVTENVTRMPELTVSNCFFADNRARALLLSTNKKVVVENNKIHSSGTAINIGGEIEKWYESGSAQDILIRNNVFENCGYAKWGRALITDGKPLEKENDIFFHHGIVIEDNKILSFNKCILSFGKVDGLIFRNNMIEKSNEFDALDEDRERFELLGSINCDIEDNQSL